MVCPVETAVHLAHRPTVVFNDSMTAPLVSFFAHSWFAKNFKLKLLKRIFGRKFSDYLLVAKKAMIVPMIASTNAAICIPFEAMTFF